MGRQGWEGLSEEMFRRLTGVRKGTFAKMAFKKQGGRSNQLAVEMRLRMVLEYWREYRTYLYIGHSDGMSESTACRTIRWYEDVLITSGAFTLLGKHALLKHERAYTVVLIDVTEIPVERPEKNSAGTTRARKNATP